VVFLHINTVILPSAARSFRLFLVRYFLVVGLTSVGIVFVSKVSARGSMVQQHESQTVLHDATVREQQKERECLFHRVLTTVVDVKYKPSGTCLSCNVGSVFN
jgi:hypothetical protein